MGVVSRHSHPETLGRDRARTEYLASNAKEKPDPWEAGDGGLYREGRGRPCWEEDRTEQRSEEAVDNRLLHLEAS